MSGAGPVATGSTHADLHESKYEEKRQENTDNVSGKMKSTSVKQGSSSSSNGNPRQAAEQWVQSFSEALASNNTSAIKQLFASECHWRDLLSFTWNLKTMEGHDEIVEMLEATLGHVQPSNWQIVDEVTVEDGISTVWLQFETAIGRCNGVLRLDSDGQAWTLLTTMYELKGYEEQQGRRRPLGTVHQVERKYRPNWLERRTEEQKELGYSKQPYVLIIGGGQGGLGLAARLKQLQVPTLIVDKHARSGDQWRSRYSSLCLHDPVWYDDLPYLKFPSHWPIFSPKDKMGDWLESYAKIMELDVWNSTMCKKASYDEHKKEWTVQVNRNGEDVTLHPTQLVFATGMSGMPSKPEFQGQEKFQGQILHSSEFKNAQQYNGKHAVVIGSNNSSFDICGELYMSGAEVTMIQRTTTHLVKSDSLMEHALGGLYSEKALEAGLSAEKADALNASIPYMVMHKFHIPVYDFIKKTDADFYRRMEEAGFMLDFGADGSGLFMKYLRRGSGYYIDVGACERVADGSIKLKTKVSVKELKEKSVVFDDGTELPADVIVCATGYRSMNTWLIDLVSPEMAYKVGKVWGLGSGTTKDPGPAEREPRNMWKPTQQEQLWFHGGNLAQSRYYSQFLALQLKARYEGLDTPVYQLAPVHHKE